MKIFNARFTFFLAALAIVCIAAVSFRKPLGYKNKKISHMFFIAGPDFTGIIGENGEISWNSGKPGARDGFVLPNGHVLICWADEVKEYDNDKKVVFNYKKSAPANELGTAVRLENGNTLITESGKEPRLLELDQQGIIKAWIPLLPETDNVHMQTRMARKLPSGNYIVPHLLAFKVKEYTPEGKVIKTFNTDLPALGGRDSENWPFTAIRLKNGNTLITLTHGNKVVEMNPDGQVVWELSNDDFQTKVLQDPCGAQRLPNGNTAIASYGANEGIRLFEIDRKKKIVWSYKRYRVHDFQILTTNGKPIKGNPLK